MQRSFLNGFFFGNYFYGICAAALTLEATLQQGNDFNPPYYYVLVAVLTVWFYTLAYLTDQIKPTINERTDWYIRNRKFVFCSQMICISTSLVILSFILYSNLGGILSLTSNRLILIIIFPLAAFAYYGVSSIPEFNLRSIGWLKPFLIGFIWAGLTTIYPVLFYNISHDLQGIMSPSGWWLFLKNFMFISVLCILFDIKDYASDANQNIKTLVVHKGLKFTIFNIVIPLTLLGVISFLIFSIANHFSVLRIVLNSLPFFALVAVAYSLHERKSILFYLFIIDGLMLFKALCGIIAFYLTK